MSHKIVWLVTNDAAKRPPMGLHLGWLIRCSRCQRARRSALAIAEHREHDAGSDGVGGVGIAGKSVTIINNGTVSGGFTGGHVGDEAYRANAITGGNNRLELWAGSAYRGLRTR